MAMSKIDIFEFHRLLQKSVQDARLHKLNDEEMIECIVRDTFEPFHKIQEQHQNELERLQREMKEVKAQTSLF